MGFLARVVKTKYIFEYSFCYTTSVRFLSYKKFYSVSTICLSLFPRNSKKMLCARISRLNRIPKFPEMLLWQGDKTRLTLSQFYQRKSCATCARQLVARKTSPCQNVVRGRIGSEKRQRSQLKSLH